MSYIKLYYIADNFESIDFSKFIDVWFEDGKLVDMVLNESFEQLMLTVG